VKAGKVRHVDFGADEWLAGTSDLTVVEKGCLITVCALIYSKGGPIDDDPAWLARNCRCDPRTWKAARRRLLELGKIQLLPPDLLSNGATGGGGKLTNSRCEQELYKARERMFRSRSASDLSVIRRRSQRERGRLS